MSDLKDLIKMQKPLDMQKVPLRPISKVQFSPLKEEKTTEERGSFENLKVNLAVVYGTKTLTLKELSNITAGSLLNLDQEESALVDIEANGAKIGRGQVVVQDGHFGIKVVELF